MTKRMTKSMGTSRLIRGAGRARGSDRATQCTERGCGERGFTLIELMVVIVILGLLLGIVVPNVFKYLRDATSDTARNQMHSIGGAIDFYMIENKSLPKSLDELTQPSPKSGEPFIKKIPDDPWGEPYDYKVINAGKREYEITSAGEDKAFGTADDIRFPEREEK